MPANIDFNMFLKFKDSLVWKQVFQWIPGKGTLKHLVWRGFKVTEGRVLDIPMFFIYVSVNEASKEIALSLTANVRFDPKGIGQQVIDTFRVGHSDSISEEYIRELLHERYGVQEVDFSKTPVGSRKNSSVVNIVMHSRMIDKKDKLLTNIYLRKIVSGVGVVKYRVECLTVSLVTGVTKDSTPQRSKPMYDTIKEGVDDFQRTVRHFQTIGFEVTTGVPDTANEQNWDFDLNMPKDMATAMRRGLEDKEEGRKFLEESIRESIEEDYLASSASQVKTGQSLSQWYQGPLPDPGQLESYVGTPSVEASQLKSMFGGVDEAISLVNRFDSSLLSNVAFIFNFASGGAYGVYLSAMDEKIKEEHLKKTLKSQGFQIDELPNGAFSASHPEKSPDEIKKIMENYYGTIQSHGGTTFGINMNKVLSAARQDVSESGLTDPEDWYDIAVMHLASTMVHEAVHAKGSTSEGPSEAAEAKFQEWVLPQINEKRKQKATGMGKADEFQPLVVNPSARRHASATQWHKAVRVEKSAQFGAQFITQIPSQMSGPAPWSGFLWDAGYGPTELALDIHRAKSRFQMDNSIEKQMREVAKQKWDNEIDPGELTETLLEKDRQPLQGYRATEKLMDEKREKPLMTPVKAEAMRKTAYYGEDGSCFGWMNNLNLPMGERMIEWPVAKEFTAFNWEEMQNLPRYNPEYDRMGFYQKWPEPRFEAELWDRMLDERPNFMTSPARRFASEGSIHDDPSRATVGMALILHAARKDIADHRILGTRFLCSEHFVPHIKRFYEGEEGIAVYEAKSHDNMTSVWVVDKSVPEKNVEVAEQYACGKTDDPEAKKVFDDICKLSSRRMEFMQAIIGKVKEACDRYGVKDVYIVGGFPRSLAMKEPTAHIMDLDFSGAWPDQCLKIGGIVAEELGVANTELFHRTMTLSWEWMGIKCDFRGNFQPIPVRGLMREQGIKTTPLNMDLYSRDLTINMFLYSLDDGKVYDVTGKGMEDIQRKVLATYFDADKVVQANPLITLRTLKYAVRYGFKIDESLSEAMKRHKDLLFDGRYSEERLVIALEEILAEGKVKGEELVEIYELERLHEIKEGEKHATSN